MPSVKPLDRISRKWARQSATAQPEYEAGVRAPRRSWSDAASKAEDSYKQGVQAGINRGAFGKGVRKAGDSKWQDATLAKGANRWSEGINLATGAYEEGFAPFRQALEQLDLPPRGPKGDPKNLQRVQAVTEALHRKKIEMAGR